MEHKLCMNNQVSDAGSGVCASHSIIYLLYLCFNYYRVIMQILILITKVLPVYLWFINDCIVIIKMFISITKVIFINCFYSFYIIIIKMEVLEHDTFSLIFNYNSIATVQLKRMYINKFKLSMEHLYKTKTGQMILITCNLIFSVI